jgi:hypothetical protein
MSSQVRPGSNKDAMLAIVLCLADPGNWRLANCRAGPRRADSQDEPRSEHRAPGERGRDRQPGPQVPLPVRGHWRIDGDLESAETGGGRLAYQRVHELAVAQHIELEPHLAVPGGGQLADRGGGYGTVRVVDVDALRPDPTASLDRVSGAYLRTWSVSTKRNMRPVPRMTWAELMVRDCSAPPWR